MLGRPSLRPPQQQFGDTGSIFNVSAGRATPLTWLSAWSPHVPVAKGGRMELKGVLAKDGRGCVSVHVSECESVASVCACVRVCVHVYVCVKV